MMPDQPKRGKRIQLYLAADLVERWEQTPRYERSKEVASALRKHWKIEKLPTKNTYNDETPQVSSDDIPQ